MVKRSGKAGMPLRTTSVQDDPTWITTRFNSCFPVVCWSLMDCTWVSSRIRSLSQICAIGRSIRNINKDGRADGVWRISNIWEKVINKDATILKVHKCCTLVNKAMSEISNCCLYFLSNLCKRVSHASWFWNNISNIDIGVHVIVLIVVREQEWHLQFTIGLYSIFIYYHLVHASS